MRNEKWYQRRLAKYFTDHYEIYEDLAKFHSDPAPNVWLFDIEPLGKRIELTCTDFGIIQEQQYDLKQ